MSPCPNHSCWGMNLKLREKFLALPSREISLWTETSLSPAGLSLSSFFFFLVVFNSVFLVWNWGNFMLPEFCKTIKWGSILQNKNLFLVTEFFSHSSYFGLSPDVNPAFSTVEEKHCPPQPGFSSSSTMPIFSASLSVGHATSIPKQPNVCAVITSHFLEKIFRKKEVIQVPTSVLEMKNHEHQVKGKFEV